jgi:hypothetical protein
LESKTQEDKIKINSHPLEVVRRQQLRKGEGEVKANRDLAISAGKGSNQEDL